MQMTLKKMGWRESIPVAGVKDDLIISREGAVTVGYELLLPVEYGVTAGVYDRMHTLFVSAFKNLPDWTVVHKQDWYVRRSYHRKGDSPSSFLQEGTDSVYEDRSYMEHRSYIFFTINPLNPGRSSVFKAYNASSAFGFKRRMLNIPKIMASVDEFVGKCDEYMSIIGSEVPSRRLRNVDYDGAEGDCGLLQSYMEFGDRDMILDSILRDETASYLDTKGKRLFGYAFSHADDLPGTTPDYVLHDGLSTEEYNICMSYTSPIGGNLDCNHIVNSYYVNVPQLDMLRELDKRRKHDTAMASDSAENTVNMMQLEEFITAVHSAQARAIYSHSNLLVWGEPDEERSLRNLVSSALAKMGCAARMSTGDLPVLYWAGMPGAALELSEDNWMLGEINQALCMTPYESYERGIEGGSMMVADRHRHIPVPLDLQDVAYSMGLIEAYNTMIIGPSGSGKSFFTNWYVRNIYDGGGQVFIIDKGDSYMGQADILREMTGGRDGIYYNWSKERPFSFNLFRNWKEWDREEDNHGMNFVMSVLKTIFRPEGGWNSANEPILMQTVTDFLSSFDGTDRDPVFQDYYDYIGNVILPKVMPKKGRRKKGEEETEGYVVGHSPVTLDMFPFDKFDTALTPFCRDWVDQKGKHHEGQYSFLLNDPSPKDLFSSRFVVFEIDALEAQGPLLYSLCTFCIMNSFEEKMRHSDGFKVMVIEEAWKAIANEEMAGYLKELWKVSRKYHTAATVVTQQVDDVVSSDIIRDAIVGNSPVKILLDQKNNASSFGQLIELMGLSEIDAALAKSVGLDIDDSYGPYKEFFVSLGGRYSGVFALEVGEREKIVFQSQKDAKKALFDLAEKVGMEEAIRRIADGKGNDNKRKSA